MAPSPGAPSGLPSLQRRHGGVPGGQTLGQAFWYGDGNDPYNPYNPYAPQEPVTPGAPANTSNLPYPGAAPLQPFDPNLFAPPGTEEGSRYSTDLEGVNPRHVPGWDPQSKDEKAQRTLYLMNQINMMWANQRMQEYEAGRARSEGIATQALADYGDSRGAYSGFIDDPNKWAGADEAMKRALGAHGYEDVIDTNLPSSIREIRGPQYNPMVDAPFSTMAAGGNRSDISSQLGRLEAGFAGPERHQIYAPDTYSAEEYYAKDYGDGRDTDAYGAFRGLSGGGVGSGDRGILGDYRGSMQARIAGLDQQAGQAEDYYRNLIRTGGVGDATASAIRSRPLSAADAAYGDARREIQRLGTVQGGNATQAALARLGQGQARSAQDTAREAELAIADMRRQGRAAGAQALTAGEQHQAALGLQADTTAHQALMQRLGLESSNKATGAGGMHQVGSDYDRLDAQNRQFYDDLNAGQALAYDQLNAQQALAYAQLNSQNLDSFNQGTLGTNQLNQRGLESALGIRTQVDRDRDSAMLSGGRALLDAENARFDRERQAGLDQYHRDVELAQMQADLNAQQQGALERRAGNLSDLLSHQYDSENARTQQQADWLAQRLGIDQSMWQQGESNLFNNLGAQDQNLWRAIGNIMSNQGLLFDQAIQPGMFEKIALSTLPGVIGGVAGRIPFPSFRRQKGGES